jgi:hypothetical protein
VRVFDGRTQTQMRGEIGTFMAYDPEFSGGVRVAAGYTDGDRRLDIITGAGPGGGPHARSFRARDGEGLSSYFSYDSNFPGGVYVASHGRIDPPAGGIVDPLEVFHATEGRWLRESIDEHEIAGYSVDLRAQVWGGTVDTYDWDVSGAMGAINVTGEDTHRLQFEWDEEAEGIQSITITTTNTDMTMQQVTLTFFIEPALGQAQPTSSDDWPDVLTPDLAQAGQELVREQYYDLSLNSGELYVPHRLPGYNPGVPALELVYSSIAADTRPIFLVRHELDPEEAAPS